MRRRSALVGAAILVGAIGLAALSFIRACADGGAMGSAYQTCECRGVEWEVYDRTAADGPRRTICIGLRESMTCQQFRDGPLVPCPS